MMEGKGMMSSLDCFLLIRGIKLLGAGLIFTIRMFNYFSSIVSYIVVEKLENVVSEKRNLIMLQVSL